MLHYFLMPAVGLALFWLCSRAIDAFSRLKP